MISAAEMRETREERRQREEEEARQARAEEARREAIRRAREQRDRLLMQTTHNIVEGVATDEEIQLICRELRAWKEVLLKFDVEKSRELIANLGLLPVAVRAILEPFIPVLELKLFSFPDGLIQSNGLRELLLLVKKIFLLGDAGPQSSFLFTTTLSNFVDSIGDQALASNQVLCLQRIVTDYGIGLLGSKNLVDDIIVAHLLASTTLNQLNRKQVLTEGMHISVDNFVEHHRILEKRIALLPLNIEVKQAIDEVILPGVASIIHDEQSIVDHVRENHGRLYYLHDKLPLHTDHVDASEPEQYRQVLQRLVINFFGAAEIAHSRGCLSLFCEKICSGYCFEGRVSAVFAWVVSLSDVVSFDETMDKYLHKEYVPYVRTMNGLSKQDVDIMLVDPVMDFIMSRHKNAGCLHHPSYAPHSKVTALGVKKYLYEILALVSQKDCDQAIAKSQRLRGSLERSAWCFWNYFKKDLIQNKINALTSLEARIITHSELPHVVAKSIKEENPRALYAHYFSSRTKKLLDQLEKEDGSELAIIARH